MADENPESIAYFFCDKFQTFIFFQNQVAALAFRVFVTFLQLNGEVRFRDGMCLREMLRHLLTAAGGRHLSQVLIVSGTPRSSQRPQWQNLLEAKFPARRRPRVWRG